MNRDFKGSYTAGIWSNVLGPEEAARKQTLTPKSGEGVIEYSTTVSGRGLPSLFNAGRYNVTPDSHLELQQFIINRATQQDLSSYMPLVPGYDLFHIGLNASKSRWNTAVDGADILWRNLMNTGLIYYTASENMLYINPYMYLANYDVDYGVATTDSNITSGTIGTDEGDAFYSDNIIDEDAGIDYYDENTDTAEIASTRFTRLATSGHDCAYPFARRMANIAHALKTAILAQNNDTNPFYTITEAEIYDRLMDYQLLIARCVASLNNIAIGLGVRDLIIQGDQWYYQNIYQYMYTSDNARRLTDAAQTLAANLRGHYYYPEYLQDYLNKFVISMSPAQYGAYRLYIPVEAGSTPISNDAPIHVVAHSVLPVNYDSDLVDDIINTLNELSDALLSSATAQAVAALNPFDFLELLTDIDVSAKLPTVNPNLLTELNRETFISTAGATCSSQADVIGNFYPSLVAYQQFGTLDADYGGSFCIGVNTFTGVVSADSTTVTLDYPAQYVFLRYNGFGYDGFVGIAEGTVTPYTNTGATNITMNTPRRSISPVGQRAIANYAAMSGYHGPVRSLDYGSDTSVVKVSSSSAAFQETGKWSHDMVRSYGIPYPNSSTLSSLHVQPTLSLLHPATATPYFGVGYGGTGSILCYASYTYDGTAYASSRFVEALDAMIESAIFPTAEGINRTTACTGNESSVSSTVSISDIGATSSLLNCMGGLTSGATVLPGAWGTISNLYDESITTCDNDISLGGFSHLRTSTLCIIPFNPNDVASNVFSSTYLAGSDYPGVTWSFLYRMCQRGNSTSDLAGYINFPSITRQIIMRQEILGAAFASSPCMSGVSWDGTYYGLGGGTTSSCTFVSSSLISPTTRWYDRSLFAGAPGSEHLSGLGQSEFFQPYGSDYLINLNLNEAGYSYNSTTAIH